MGGGQKRGRTQRRHFRQDRENVWKYGNKKTRPEDDSAPNSNPNLIQSWEPFSTQNLCFEEYYKGQLIVPEEEWEAFMSILRKPLPAAFRINASGQFYKDIRLQLENDFMKFLETEISDDSENEAIRPLPWYPDKLAWHLNFSRMQLRKNQTLERFHEFLKQENEVGAITRQEAVSMVPPLFLDVHPDHYILDMCAAPGSKTFQLLEIIHQSIKPGSLPYGLVVANDADVQRCNLLIHQTKRMCSANLIVTNHEAQFFPSLPAEDFSRDVQGGLKRDILQFDRILCDVPCSGDGTLRKAPDIWRKWNTGMGNGLHRLQVEIAMRGVTLLKVGGRMVYSTCSMNPVENEAVVAEILRRSKGSVKLLDVSLELPGLIRRDGLNMWKVRDKRLWLASYEDVPISCRGVILPSLFPPYQRYKLNEHKSEDSSLDLKHCMRILPHDQNSGAFFIAVLHKISSLHDDATKGTGQSSTVHKPQKSQNLELGNDDQQPKTMLYMDASHTVPDVPKPTHVSNLTEAFSLRMPAENGQGSQGSDSCLVDDETDKVAAFDGGQDDTLTKESIQRQGKWRGVDPVVFFDDEKMISSIKSFYGISELFPLASHLVTRSSDADHVKRIYYISNSVHDLLELNFKAGLKLKITSLGLKIFERQSSKNESTTCIFRLSSEGLPLLLPHIGKQILSASLADFRHLLQYRVIKFSDFVDADFREKTSVLMPGCCVIVMKQANEETFQCPVDSSTIAIVCWKGKTNLSVLVSQSDSRELLDRLTARFGIHSTSAYEESNSLLEERQSIADMEMT